MAKRIFHFENEVIDSLFSLLIKIGHKNKALQDMINEKKKLKRFHYYHSF